MRAGTQEWGEPREFGPLLSPNHLISLAFRGKIMTVAHILSMAKRAAIVAALCEGNSARATSRLVDVSCDTVAKLNLELGEECIRYMDANLRNLKCRRLEVDEIWAFCRCKAKNVPQDKVGTLGFGDLWAFT